MRLMELVLSIKRVLELMPQFKKTTSLKGSKCWWGSPESYKLLLGDEATPCRNLYGLEKPEPADFLAHHHKQRVNSSNNNNT